MTYQTVRYKAGRLSSHMVRTERTCTKRQLTRGRNILRDGQNMETGSRNESDVISQSPWVHSPLMGNGILVLLPVTPRETNL